MDKTSKLGIAVTYENGRIKILGNMKPEDFAELPICHAQLALGDPMQRPGCVLEPPSDVKCPPGRFFIELGLTHRDELKVLGIRPAEDLGDRRSRGQGRRSTDRSPEADA